MARLKVKQISDFTTAVQTLIDNDVDQGAVSIANNASSIAANASLNVVQDASIDALEALAATGTTADADAVASINSLEALAATGITADADAVASINSLETVASTSIDADADAVASIGSLETLAGNNKSKNDDDTASINSLEALAATGITADADAVASINSLETVSGDNASAITAILDGSTTDLDQFAEVVAYVGSLDILQGGELTNGLAAANASIDSLETVASTGITADADAVASINSLETLAANNATLNGQQDDSIDSLETVAGTGITADADAVASINSLETLAANNATLNGQQDASIGSLETVDSGLASDVTSLESLIGSVNAAGTYIKQGGTPVSATSFRVVDAVRFGAADDLLVFINGLEVHPTGTIVLAEDDFGSSPVSTIEGFNTVDGMNFNLVSLGYDLEPTDHVHVVAIGA